MSSKTVQTKLSKKNVDRLDAVADVLGMTRYQAIQEAIRIFVHGILDVSSEIQDASKSLNDARMRAEMRMDELIASLRKSPENRSPIKKIVALLNRSEDAEAIAYFNDLPGHVQGYVKMQLKKADGDLSKRLEGMPEVYPSEKGDTT